MADPQRARRTFGPVVLLGLASAGLAAVAGTRTWVTGRSGSVDTSAGSAMTSALSLDVVGESPLAGALALAVLACWGVVLVTRGRVRRAVALLGLVGAVGLLVATVAEFWTLPDKLADALTEVSGVGTATTSFTPWYAAALVGGLLSVLTTVAAVRLVGRWPEMGTKYDAPAGARAQAAPARPTENIDIWKALDEGRDPTA
ncbi:Trp biosynthesis-associated membrane protein [Nocardioides sp.]|uniref:Trp biosynthesis-associated membrane protein n=1 Tax=Nocardioides sp. TaxID=35761 RepID=UPI002638FF21|nr:Trp biosynthesis-associated membrane protein [Nocardioides sp.]MCW2738427.1 hypothetical protein [Nocardioides sp.]